MQFVHLGAFNFCQSQCGSGERKECSVTAWKRDIWFRRDNGGLGTVEMHGAEQLSKDTFGDICAHPSLELGAAGALTALWIFGSGLKRQPGMEG